ncbi:pleckstrin homology domain-containing family D member 1 isoform X2 [Octopus bimaculoides]|nr:pleckstrin homology domain-containing family D member 1 isoform X2 [Octopus bimaculoides]|eukprot:XP_014772545.1 PREDICTED: pleckstrin homology domain-containing family D member 1-like isoform X2 [Octopus bimaculoides]
MACVFPCCCGRYVYREHVNSAMNGMPEADPLTFKPPDWKNYVQHFGCLYKRPVGHQSTKWSKRFFILKDGYLLYYPENEKKEIDKRQHLNIHPKGIVPLGDCQVNATQDPSHQFAFIVSSAQINGRIILAAENEFERNRWVEMLRKSSQVTWKCLQLGNLMIKQLETQGQQMAHDKQTYYDRLQNEVIALSDTKQRADELERLNEELAKEKSRMEQLLKDMEDDYQCVKEELMETSTAMAELETNSSELIGTLEQQKSELQILASEREKILTALKEKEGETETLSKKNETLAQTTANLRHTLGTIELKTKELLYEKAEAEKQLSENDERTSQLKAEKEYFSDQAHSMQATILDLNAQKELTESELREEILARIDAERRLRKAEKSLQYLDQAVTAETVNIEEGIREGMIVNVGMLKTFFEDLAAESKIDANKPVVIKNMVHARKTLTRKANTLKFEKRRRSCKNRPSSLVLDDEDGKTRNPIRRAKTSVTQSSKYLAKDTNNSDNLLQPLINDECVLSERM